MKYKKWVKKNWLLLTAAGAGALLLQQSYSKSIDEINAKYEAEQKELERQREAAASAEAANAVIEKQNRLLIQQLEEVAKVARGTYQGLFNLRKQVRTQLHNTSRYRRVSIGAKNWLKRKLEEDPNFGDTVYLNYEHYSNGVTYPIRLTINQWLTKDISGTQNPPWTFNQQFVMSKHPTRNHVYSQQDEAWQLFLPIDQIPNVSHAYGEEYDAGFMAFGDALYYNEEIKKLYASKDSYFGTEKLHDMIQASGEYTNQPSWDKTPTYSKLIWFIGDNRHLSDPDLYEMSPSDRKRVLTDMISAITKLEAIESGYAYEINQFLRTNNYPSTHQNGLKYVPVGDMGWLTQQHKYWKQVASYYTILFDAIGGPSISGGDGYMGSSTDQDRSFAEQGLLPKHLFWGWPSTGDGYNITKMEPYNLTEFPSLVALLERRRL